MSCWASFRGDCGGKISREHYITKAILPMEVTVEGPSWTDGEPKTVSRESLNAKCLCEQHNSELSVLDSEVKKLFDFIQKINKDFAKPRYAFRIDLCILDGQKLLRWCCKTIAGIHSVYNKECPELIRRAAFSDEHAQELGFCCIASEGASLSHLSGHVRFEEFVPESDNPDFKTAYAIAFCNFAFFVYQDRKHRASGVFLGIPLGTDQVDRLREINIENDSNKKKPLKRVIKITW